MTYDFEFLDLDLELKESQAKIKAMGKEGWSIVAVYARNLNDGKRDFFRHMIIMSRETEKSSELAERLSLTRELRYGLKDVDADFKLPPEPMKSHA